MGPTPPPPPPPGGVAKHSPGPVLVRLHLVSPFVQMGDTPIDMEDLKAEVAGLTEPEPEPEAAPSTDPWAPVAFDFLMGVHPTGRGWAGGSPLPLFHPCGPP